MSVLTRLAAALAVAALAVAALAAPAVAADRKPNVIILLADNGGQGFGLPLTETTMANRMKALGYATCAVGKWHLGGPPDFLPMKRGFDEFFGTVANTPYRNPPHFVDSRVSEEVHAIKDPD